MDGVRTALTADLTRHLTEFLKALAMQEMVLTSNESQARGTHLALEYPQEHEQHVESGIDRFWQRGLDVGLTVRVPRGEAILVVHGQYFVKLFCGIKHVVS
jgi:hypothetical protein